MEKSSKASYHEMSNRAVVILINETQLTILIIRLMSTSSDFGLKFFRKKSTQKTWLSCGHKY